MYKSAVLYRKLQKSAWEQTVSPAQRVPIDGGRMRNQDLILEMPAKTTAEVDFLKHPGGPRRLVDVTANQDRRGSRFDQAPQPPASSMPATGDPIPPSPGRRMGHENRMGIDQGRQTIQAPPFKPADAGTKRDGQGSTDAENLETVKLMTLAIEGIKPLGRGYHMFDPAGVGVAAHGIDRF
jgi:hypothetical protein